jgi:hypothetical protein
MPAAKEDNNLNSETHGSDQLGTLFPNQEKRSNIMTLQLKNSLMEIIAQSISHQRKPGEGGCRT